MARDPDIDVGIDDPAWSAALPDYESICRRAAVAAAAVRSEPQEAAEIALMLTGDAAVRDLNRTYRHMDKATNVLSFPGDADATPAGHPRMLGDVVLAYGTVSGEAEAQGKPLADHVTHLVVHGVLHLLGFDHEEDDEAAEMEGLEVRILAQLGIPDPYQEAAVIRHEAVER
ncbi:putative rRNA maturation factor [Constrictibacter sp. MBR-5]|jgi:probable rRNA maturation factor|uniref:rRNA maturation RNase YbeY n=1 Tax=Constrictibacter sp. MBR-5 TaxID=3156467 RepID=UPI0033998678